MHFVKIENAYMDADKVLLIEPCDKSVTGIDYKTRIVLLTGSKYYETIFSKLIVEEVYGIISKAIGQE